MALFSVFVLHFSSPYRIVIGGMHPRHGKDLKQDSRHFGHSRNEEGSR